MNLFKLSPNMIVDYISDTGRLTQLIALAGPSGGWRKTIIDKSIASVPLAYPFSSR